ncbi:MAG TPA: polymer-forming cytoskeletal protein [Methylomirabilota bacterium]|nr:polymer-forming cytoskeletal protein [Methylomirabilota bacterium]
MPAKPQEKALVLCPHCGHQQPEPRAAISSNCRKCGQYLRIQELLNPTPKAQTKAPDQKRVNCFDCGTEVEVPAAAKSAMCKRCSSYIDLQDYTINSGVSKNFRTKGRFVVEAKGYVFNTDIIAREIVVRGKVIGKLAAEQSLTIYSTAEIRGAFRTPLLVVPAQNVLHWREPLRVGSVEISGEVVSHIEAELTVTVRASGRLFGNVRARNLVMEEGAILVGTVNVGNRLPDK